MILSNKQKAIAAFVLSLAIGILGVLAAYSGFDEGTKGLLQLFIGILGVIAIPLGVYGTTNKPTGDVAVDEVENPDLTTVDATATPAPVAAPVTPTAEVTGE
jgi:hypothetical protein